MINVVQAGSHKPEEFIKSIQGKKNEGEKIYQHFCANCHALKPLIPLGAPRIGVEVDWKNRLKKGINELLKHTDEGINAMPARGGCFECSDEQLVQAVAYMLPKKSKKTFINDLYDHKKIMK